MSAASGGGDAGAWLRISPDGLIDLLECPEDFTAIMLPLCRWFMGLPFERPIGVRGSVFATMQAGQERNLTTWRKVSDGGRRGGGSKSEAKVSAARENGRNGGRPRNTENPSPLGENPSPLGENPSNERNETITKTETKRNENGTPQADTASPSLSDSVVSAEIEAAAQRLGDCSPSRDKWRRFMQTHGAPAFRAMVDRVAAAQGVAKRGAYLNRLLDAYVPAPPPAPKPKPREWTRKDWCLCEERCAHFDACAARCSKGITTPPGKGEYQYPPDECEHYKALDSAERDARVGDTLSSLAGDLAKGMCARSVTANRERIAV